MTVSDNLSKHIVVEVLALFLLVGSILYAVIAINGTGNNVVSKNGVIAILDDTAVKKIEAVSDGVGMESDGYVYAVTNNNSNDITYKVVIYLSNLNEETIKYLRVSGDGYTVSNFSDLEKYEDGYVLGTYSLESGYTRRHAIKVWYSSDTPEDVIREKINLTFETVI